jgi:glycosyltransferase involved in cell wall biosynthesis
VRIAVEATAACRPRRSGIGGYTVRLIEALLAGPARDGGDRFHLGYRLSRWRERRHRFLPPGAPPFWIQEPFLPLLRPFDVVHGTDGRVPHWRGVARVATVHDLGPLLFEDFSSPRFRERVRRILRRLTSLCHVIIADSQATRQDFLRLFHFPPERLAVVHLGVESAFQPLSSERAAPVLRQYGLAPGYLFYAGEISRRKNIRRLIEGYAASAAGRERPLVLAGSLSFGAGALLSIIPAAGLEDRVRLLGFVPDAHLPALYSGAGAFVFPTRYEGFGMPVLEAMACGLPVVAGLRGSVPEVAGGHAVLVDPDDPQEIAAGIGRALALPSEAREAARRHASTFTWRRCAERTRACYERALALH